MARQISNETTFTVLSGPKQKQVEEEVTCKWFYKTEPETWQKKTLLAFIHAGLQATARKITQAKYMQQASAIETYKTVAPLLDALKAAGKMAEVNAYIKAMADKGLPMIETATTEFVLTEDDFKADAPAVIQAENESK